MAAERTFLRQLRSGWVVGILGTTTVHALPRFEIPPGCGTIEEYQAGIRTRLGAEASDLLEALSVKIAQQDTGYRLEVRLGTSTRQIEDQDCRALLRAATVIAIALWESPKRTPYVEREPVAGQPEGSEPPLESSGSGALERESSNVPSRSPSSLAPPLPAYVDATGPSAALSADPVTFWSIGVEGHAGAIVGLVPGISGILGLEPRLRYGSLEFAASVDYVIPREQVDAGGYGVRVSAFGLAPALTWYPHPRVGLQGGFAGYYLTGAGRGSERDQTDHAWMFGPKVGIRAPVLQHRGLWVALGGMAQIELIRPRFEIRAYGEVFRPFWVNGSVHLGVGFAFD